MDLQFWFLFFSSALALNIAPGPDLVYILTKTLSGGKRAGLVSILGLSAGAFIHVILAALGVSLILKSSELAFTIVKFIGAGYLLYLAYQSVTAKKEEEESYLDRAENESLISIFNQGILVDLFNPKVALFFIAYLPAFIREDAGSISFQLMYLGALVIAVAIIVESIYVILGSKVADRIKKNGNFKLYIDRTVAIIFCLLAMKLVYSVNT